MEDRGRGLPGLHRRRRQGQRLLRRGDQAQPGAADRRPTLTTSVRTARLRLTPVGPEDIEDLLLLYGDPIVARWTGPWTPESVAAWAVAMARRWSTAGVAKWMARDVADGSLVGRGGFTRIELDGTTVLELGWVVRDALTGRGYATELGRAAIAWAGEHFPELPIVAFTEVHNGASRAVMERLGMRLAGIIRRPGLVEGEPGIHPDAPFALYRL
ncbi:GNAT family N-acetyltransferase [Actinoplanes sp. CA-030573]|uniref:GNAT family N-acetyltransferase n=1 Tax=Actinoplanes sp. CA-030573 TaxID=3239898 RepID=UPI003D94545D